MSSPFPQPDNRQLSDAEFQIFAVAFAAGALVTLIVGTVVLRWA